VRLGDEVITVSHSFIATANSVRYCGAIPVFIDIQPDTYNMNPALIESAISDKTKAILCVHQLGMPCDMVEIIKIGDRYKIPVIEDAACAIGSETNWKNKWVKIGIPLGQIVCFSFHPRKLLTTGDGGMLTTAQSDCDKKFRLLRQHGMSVQDLARHESKKVVSEAYEILGYNYRLTDIQAAIGREQLKRLPEVIAHRRQQVEYYRRLLQGVPGVALPAEPAWARSNWQSYCIRIPDGCDQQTVMQAMLDDGIATRRGVMCAHREPAYKDGEWLCSRRGVCQCNTGHCDQLVESERAQDRTIILPLYHLLSESDQERVVESLNRACKR
jgi:dTDP-4-amino-4,6-dideoxygalactose transaminase